MSAEYYLMATESSVVGAVVRTSKQPIQAAATQLSSLCGSWFAPPKLSCSLVGEMQAQAAGMARRRADERTGGYIIPLPYAPSGCWPALMRLCPCFSCCKCFVLEFRADYAARSEDFLYLPMISA